MRPAHGTNHKVTAIMIKESLSHYRILRQLGSGGMGAVYLAEDTRLRRNVALKILPANVSADEARRRFTQEARAASALNHPNIIGIYDIGSDKGHDFIVMEFVEGEQLRRPLPRKKDEIKRALDVSPVASQTSGNGRRASLIWKVLGVMLGAGGITDGWGMGQNG